MKNILKFILFLTYTISIFFIKNYVLLVVILFINIFLMILTKIKIIYALKNILKLLPFILFTMLINIFFEDLSFAVLIGIRLSLVCNISYIFSKNISYTEFAEVIEKITYPLCIFKINPREIGIIIIIALSFLPILKNEFKQIINSLKSKGVKINKLNMIKNLNLIFKPFFVSVLQRINEVENSLRAKGFEG